MILFGASGHAKVVSSACQENISFYFDDEADGNMFLGKEVVVYDKKRSTNEKLVIAIGDNKIRRVIAEKVDHNFGSVVATSAEVDSSVILNEGSQILHGTIIQCNVRIGAHSIVNTGASVDHDCTIGDFCHLAPQVTLCGNVSIGNGTMVGAGSTVIPGVKIGDRCTIGAGSVVLTDIPNGATAVGNPARVIKNK